ncbi:DUF3826 domain-containing protein [Fibrella arboris]|uniref:DUF3826 domain-containing protein n=1 Tax=Fibrella arboris TaxID=3242486 RepID=UPI003522D854
MKNVVNTCLVIATLLATSVAFCQGQPVQPASAIDANVKADNELGKKASEWIGSLNLNDAEKEKRLTDVVATHLNAIRDWHNEHPASTVPAGINPLTGNPLTELDRQVIADSAIPKNVHQALMTGLQKDLDKQQVNAVLDKYTIGKVAFTMAGYKAIVPNMTAQEEETILGYMEQAREQAVDYKSMKEISAIFEIYKTKSEQYLNANGRNWREMYSAYTAAAKAKKAAEKKQATN